MYSYSAYCIPIVTSQDRTPDIVPGINSENSFDDITRAIRYCVNQCFHKSLGKSKARYRRNLVMKIIWELIKKISFSINDYVILSRKVELTHCLVRNERKFTFSV